MLLYQSFAFQRLFPIKNPPNSSATNRASAPAFVFFITRVGVAFSVCIFVAECVTIRARGERYDGDF